MTINNVLGQPAAAPFYVWANSDCSNKSADFEEAKRIRTSLILDGADDVYIVDADGVEVVDSAIEAEEAIAAAGHDSLKAANAAAKAAGQALEQVNPWGYRSTDSEP